MYREEPIINICAFCLFKWSIYIKLRYCREQTNLNSYSTVKNNEGIINFLKAYQGIRKLSLKTLIFRKHEQFSKSGSW